MFALQCKNQDYNILDFVGHVLQNWRDVCAYFTPTPSFGNVVIICCILKCLARSMSKTCTITRNTQT
jgi:hypothetical protein